MTILKSLEWRWYNGIKKEKRKSRKGNWGKREKEKVEIWEREEKKKVRTVDAWVMVT